MPGEGSSDNLHRGELDLIEDVDREDLEVDTFDDLISTVQNSEVAAAAASVRSARQQDEKKSEEEEEHEEVAQDLFGLEFIGDMGAEGDGDGGGGAGRAYKTGGGDDEEESEEEEDEDESTAPVDEPEQGDSTTGGHTWSTIAYAPAPPASSAPPPDPNSWVSPRDSEQE